MNTQLPNIEEIPSWSWMSDSKKERVTADYENSKPYIERFLEIKQQLDALKAELSEDPDLWGGLCVPTRDLEQELSDIGVWDAWVPSAQDC